MTEGVLANDQNEEELNLLALNHMYGDVVEGFQMRNIMTCCLMLTPKGKLSSRGKSKTKRKKLKNK
jgi:hypothetical protein